MAIPNQRLWVIGGVVLVGVVLLSGEDGPEAPRCEVEVTADVLNVRAAAGTEHPVVDQLRAGDTTEARPVTENGFRQLDEGRWAATAFLVPTEGSDCR